MKSKRAYYIFCFLFAIFISQTHAFGEVSKKTPDDVYVLTEEVVVNFEALRKKMEISTPVKQPEYEKVTTADATIMQTYKILEQLGLLQKREGLSAPVPIPNKPAGKITPKEVYHVVEIIISEYKVLASELNMPDYVTNNTSVKGKTPSDVYQRLLYAERLLISINESYK